MIKRTLIILLLFFAGCTNGPISSKFQEGGNVVKISERERVYPVKYFIEYECSQCGQFHIREVTKEQYEKLSLGQDYSEFLR